MLRNFGEFSLPPTFCITYKIMKKYYPGKPVNIHIQSSINITQENNWVITTKNGKGKLPLFCGDGERIITIYGYRHVRNIPDTRLFMRSK